jgi:peptidoglycan/xylan/chitin deacetylase (PgdA/CDA1 family)
MIGVSVDDSVKDAASEFFELFKTPWEWLVPGKRYPAVVIADGRTEPRNVKLAFIYGPAEHPIDRQTKVTLERTDGAVVAQSRDWKLPIYGPSATFRGAVRGAVLSTIDGPIDYTATFGDVVVRRVGYDVFREVAQLLSTGQPPSNAWSPTLELHIALLRRALQDVAIPYVEVPPRPNGNSFFCCLTHDIDFFGLRRHGADRTLAGFLYRATARTIGDLLWGRCSAKEFMRNWLAVASLPLVMAGLREDPWNPFRDYAAADEGRKSTFFLVPFKNHPGVAADGAPVPSRAVAYGIDDIESEVRNVSAPAVEMAVHGLDAWRDSAAGRRERAAIERVTTQKAAGVRMHWLYFSEQSPGHIEDGGFEYDATCGYNDAVGFRAGTLQAFRLRGTRQLLELPLAIMDTAMFYPDRMGLSFEEAELSCSRIIDNARQFGGALVINWHDRSLAPERQWRRPYQQLQERIAASGGSFVTASEAVEWFRWRRAVRFVESESTELQAPALPAGLPPARVVVRQGPESREFDFSGGTRTLSH